VFEIASRIALTFGREHLLIYNDVLEAFTMDRVILQGHQRLDLPRSAFDSSRNAARATIEERTNGACDKSTRALSIIHTRPSFTPLCGALVQSFPT
jgi:hypothetical protein